ncbi:HAMP domain-containing sensor histidine kinase [Clostridium ganghwense]
MIALSFMSAFDFIEKNEYIAKDAYFNSYKFKHELVEYYRNVEILLKDTQKADDELEEVKQESTKNLENKKRKSLEKYEKTKKYIDSRKFFKYYIVEKESGEIHTNLEETSDIENYIQNKALYSINFPKKYIRDGYIQPINEWFQVNGFEGSFIILEDVEGYSQIQKDYEYYNSIKVRVIKEEIICVFSLLIGLSILIYIVKNKRDEISYIEKIGILYEKIPLDSRICIFIICSFLILIYQVNVNFFYLPMNISHVIKLTIVAFYVFYLILNIKIAIRLIKDAEERAIQWKDSSIYQFTALVKDSSMSKNIISKINIIFILTILLGIFICAALITLFSGDGFIFVISAVYIFIYLLLVPQYILKKTASLNKIIKATDEIVSGNLNYTIEENEKGNLSKLAHNINNMKEGFRKSVESQVKSERLKSELITNVSHDLKTPLTSIINYINLLKKEDLSKEESSAYIEILDRKSQRLKILIDDLFEASKIASGAAELNVERVDIVAILRQAMGEFDEKIENSSLTFRVNIPKKNIYMNLDGKRTWRVFENLIGNILKYSMPNTRAYIDLKEEENKVLIIMKNISAYEMDFDVEEIFERFKRGDKSRNTEGSGLGLAIAKSIVELQGGNMRIDIDGDLFKVSVELNK